MNNLTKEREDAIDQIIEDSINEVLVDSFNELNAYVVLENGRAAIELMGQEDPRTIQPDGHHFDIFHKTVDLAAAIRSGLVTEDNVDGLLAAIEQAIAEVRSRPE